MAIEQKWPAVAPQLFTGNGTQYGVIKVVDASGFKVKQKVVISAIGQPQIEVQVKRVIGPDTIIVGPFPTSQQNNTLTSRTDLTVYTVATSASIYATEQDKSKLKPEDILQAIYRQEPSTTVGVEINDEFGRPIHSVVDSDGKVRLAVDAAVTLEDLTISLDALSPPDQGNPDNVLVAGSEDGTKGGLKHAVRVDSALDLRVGISNGANKAAIDVSGRISVIDADVLSQLNSIKSVLPTTLGQKPMAGSLSVTLASDQTPIQVIATLADEPLKISGTENGQPGGPEFTFVNNLRQQILAAKDRDQAFVYADFGTKNQRITQVNYTAPSIGAGAGFTARKTLNYSLIGNRYRRDNIIWSLV